MIILVQVREKHVDPTDDYTNPPSATVAQVLLQSESLPTPITLFHLKLKHKCYNNYKHAKQL